MSTRIIYWDLFFSNKTSPPGRRPGGQNSLQLQNVLPRANYISPFQHFTIDGNVSQKYRSAIGNFHHITIKPYNKFTISSFVQKILVHHEKIGKRKKCTISPQNHIDTLQASYHITTSPYNDFRISHFHHGATTVNPCGIIKREVINI